MLNVERLKRKEHLLLIPFVDLVCLLLNYRLAPAQK